MNTPDKPDGLPDGPSEWDTRFHGAAHDLNELLGIILGRTQLLLAGDPDANTRAQLEVVESAVQDGAAILAEAMNGIPHQQPATRGAQALSDIVATCLERTRHHWEIQAERQGIRYEIFTNIPADLKTEVSPTALREVVTNLLVNALEAMPSGGRLSLRAKGRSTELHLFVRDSGQGMNAQTVDRIFQPGFSRGKPTGKGLGLAVCQRLMKAMGGRIRVRSEPGAGSEFEVVLPGAGVVGTHRQGTAPEENQAGRRSGYPPTPKNLRVLVVDNELRVREMVTELLLADGHSVVSAQEGQEALGRLRPGAFDVVVVDWNMPGLSGLELVQAIRGRDRAVALVVMTGWGKTALDRIRESGLVDLTATKPIDLQALRGLLGTAAEVAHRRRAAAATE